MLVIPRIRLNGRPTGARIARADDSRLLPASPGMSRLLPATPGCSGSTAQLGHATASSPTFPLPSRTRRGGATRPLSFGTAPPPRPRPRHGHGTDWIARARAETLSARSGAIHLAGGTPKRGKRGICLARAAQRSRADLLPPVFGRGLGCELLLQKASRNRSQSDSETSKSIADSP